MAANQFVVAATAANFESVVVEQSRKAPVLVDFWAAWCGPCRILGPVLEKLAGEFGGAFVLAKVDIEESPQLAAHFAIRGIPAVKLFRDGAVVDEFVGALPEAAVRDFLAKHCPSKADELMVEATEFLAKGYRESAITKLEEVLGENPEHGGAHLALARLALAEGDHAAVKKHIAAIPPTAKEAEAAQSLGEALRFAVQCSEVGGEETCRRRIAANANDLDARLGLGSCLAASGDYRAALDEFLGVVARDKSYRDEAARKAMVTIFRVLGVRSDLANEYRQKLATYL